MRKIVFIIIAFVVSQQTVFAVENGRREVGKNALDGFAKAVSQSVEQAVGRVIDLEKIVVSPDRIRESSAMTASDVTVIGRTEIDQKKDNFVKDILANQAGVSLTSSGTFGGQADIRIRGANPNHTLVLIDGVKVYDPASTNGAFNFANLPFDNIEQIEVLRGAQSSLYGSDAIGGVISIESKKPDSPFLETGIESGSFRTITEYVNLGGYEKGMHYSFAFSQFNTQGISSADKRTIPNIEEDDPYSRTSVAGRLDYEITPDLTIGTTFRNIYARNKYDDSNPVTWALQDNDQLTGTSNMFLYSLYVEHKPLEYYDYSVRYSYMDNLRRDFDPSAGLRDWYDGTANRFDFQNNFHVKDFDIVTVGYDYAFERSDSYYYNIAGGESDEPKVFARNSALYLQNKAFYQDVIGSAQSMRIDHHSQFGTNTTYKIDGFYRAPTGTRARGSYATSFKAPSLYQLHAPANPAWAFLGGSPNLNPEKARSFELGVDQYVLNNAIKLSVTYFYTRFSDLIQYFTDPVTFQSTYTNATKAKSLGMEYGVEVNMFDEKLKLVASATSLGTKDYSTDRQLARVPVDQFNININVKPIQRLTINTNVGYTGMRLNTGTDKMKAYTKVDLVAEYAISKEISIYARVENLFNEYYQEVRGYGTPGFSAYGGIKTKF